MEIKITEKPESLVVAVVGDVNFEEVDAFRSEMDRLVHTYDKDMVLDLKDCPYLCSSGLGIIGMVLKDLKAQGHSLKLLNPSEKVMRILRATRLTSLLETAGGASGVPLDE